ncbi:MAG: dTMP kinase [Dehalogenimonas sp.]
MKPGLFITLEGCEGSGKSTQAKMLTSRLKQDGYEVVLTREPGGTPLGEEISNILKWSKPGSINTVSELLLFNASRAQLVTDIISPALSSGKVVICDRYADSSLVYQGLGRGLQTETIRQANEIAVQGLSPDLTILLDIPVETGRERKRHDTADRFEQESVEFHRRVRDAYLKLAEEEPERWRIIKGTAPKEEISEAIWDNVKAMLNA